MNAILDHVQDEAPNIRTFFFKSERPLRYVAGQFIEMTVAHDNVDERGTKHWFTLSSAPGRELVSITTKHADKPSTFKQTLWALKPGESVDISEPMGDFVLPKDPAAPLVFVAGGIGITPYHSIVSWLIDQKQTRQIQFLYSVHEASEVIFQDTFNQDFIEIQTFLGEPNLTADRIVKLVGGIDNKQVYISGPEPMTEAIVDQFNALGLTQDQLITDYFPGYPA